MQPGETADLFEDDRLDTKRAAAFDPNLVYDLCAGEGGAWQQNRSAAVLCLDVPKIMVREDAAQHLIVLHASYAAAASAARAQGTLLASINAVDAKAKQFDDGLVAALDVACFRGLGGRMTGRVDLVRRLLEAVGPASGAAPHLAAALSLAGEEAEPADAAGKRRLLAGFKKNELWSKPAGFYTRSDELGRVYRFTRFLQRDIAADDFPGGVDLAAALARDADLRAAYQRTIAFDAGLRNPATCGSLLDLGGVVPRVAVLPPPSSREVELFGRIFPVGLPAGADLVAELVRRVRSGEVDLAPRSAGGWLDRQVFALETLLLPERATERDKLVLTGGYKERMLEAFKSLIVTRLDKAYFMPLSLFGAVPKPRTVPPTLRVEPCATFALRTARAYAFLEAFLVAAMGEDALRSLCRLREPGLRARATVGGTATRLGCVLRVTLGRRKPPPKPPARDVHERDEDLLAELRRMRDLFYGLHIVSAEDVGMRPWIAADEPVDCARCKALSLEWLGNWTEDPDLAVDRRVAVPVYADRRETRIWATIGVRLTQLFVDWASMPKIRSADGSSPWEVLPEWSPGVCYLVPTDEFAEISRGPGRALAREDLRRVCDRKGTRAAIIEALRE
ncbi:MAG: hypothetical protein MUE73_14150 [Planctomycetes bacterium]|nr:hypothetical protein [Planctomycetota bacterium]